MAFTYADYHALFEALLAHPEWRAELRPLILGEGFEALPAIVRGTNERLDRLEAVVTELAEAQRGANQRLDRLEAVVTHLAEGQRALVEGQRSLEAALKELVATVDNMAGRLGNLEGSELEHRYNLHLENRVSHLLRRPRRINIAELDRVVDAFDAGEISAAEYRRLQDLDVLAAGGDRSSPGREDTLLAGELSWTINFDDVARVQMAVDILRRVGYRVKGMVGGYRIREAPADEADRLGLIVELHSPPSHVP